MRAQVFKQSAHGLCLLSIGIMLVLGGCGSDAAPSGDRCCPGTIAASTSVSVGGNLEQGTPVHPAPLDPTATTGLNVIVAFSEYWKDLLPDLR